MLIKKLLSCLLIFSLAFTQLGHNYIFATNEDELVDIYSTQPTTPDKTPQPILKFFIKCCTVAKILSEFVLAPLRMTFSVDNLVVGALAFVIELDFERQLTLTRLDSIMGSILGSILGNMFGTLSEIYSKFRLNKNDFYKEYCNPNIKYSKWLSRDIMINFWCDQLRINGYPHEESNNTSANQIDYKHKFEQAMAVLSKTHPNFEKCLKQLNITTSDLNLYATQDFYKCLNSETNDATPSDTNKQEL